MYPEACALPPPQPNPRSLHLNMKLQAGATNPALGKLHKKPWLRWKCICLYKSPYRPVYGLWCHAVLLRILAATFGLAQVTGKSELWFPHWNKVVKLYLPHQVRQTPLRASGISARVPGSDDKHENNILQCLVFPGE